MDSRARPRSALASVAAGPPLAGRPADAAEVEIYEDSGSAIVHLEAPRPGQGLAAFLEGLGLMDLPAPGRSGGGEGGQLLSIGPSIWLFVGEPRAAGISFGEAFDAAVDISDGWTRLVVSGKRSTELLAKGCALDFHPSRFRPGSCAATGFARMRTIVWRSLDARFDLFVGRSYALSLWDWLAEAALEFGFHGDKN
jgi:heterotetrameric sarcosine oxidase gamma subunit